MLEIKTKHFLTGEELSRPELLALLDEAEALRKERPNHQTPKIEKQTLVLLFEKPSLRTRVSFTVAMQELGGKVVEVVSNFRKKEEPEDLVRVLAGYSHAIMMRTFDHSILDRMVSKSTVPVINGLSDSHHPCQALADVLTLKQSFGKLEGLQLTYIGDGNNVLHSLMLLAPFVGIHLRYACPQGFEPNAFITRRARQRATEGGGSITAFTNAADAVKGANALYTDVWTSMGFEQEETEREAAFDGYQLGEELMALAEPNAVIMHCMPMVRGKEISDAAADSPNSVIFQQSENRLHVQKALLKGLLSAGK